MNYSSPNDCPWIGGFEDSNPDFKYPDPNLTSLELLDNMANIDKLQRQMKALWPEFSWLTHPGEERSRCFQMFAPDISRIGYTAEGRVYSIICPQQGAYLNSVGINLNVEVTVTGQRGWVNEDTREMAADLTVTGKIWFSPNNDNELVKLLFDVLNASPYKFPLTKQNAIEVQTSRVGDATAYFPLLRDATRRFESPSFAQHKDEAFTVAHIDVQINNIKSTGNEIVDQFNEIVLGIFNILAGNMLKNESVLSWNVWFDEPSVVDREEWRQHAIRWRESIDVDHRSPEGDGTRARYFNGEYLEINTWEVLVELYKLIHKVLLPNASALGLPRDYLQDLGTRVLTELSVLDAAE